MMKKLKRRLKSYNFIVKMHSYFFSSLHSAFDYKKIINSQHDAIKKLPKISQNLKFSIFIAVCQPDLVLLKRIIGRLLNQSYLNVEIIVIDEVIENFELNAYIDSLTQARIKVIERKTNSHLHVALNSVLKVATGDFIVFLDQNGLLHKESLKTVAYWIEQHPDADIFYADEDKIDTKGTRYDPLFKPEFNLDLLYSNNYIAHFGLYRRTLLEEMACFRFELQGSQHYELLLRAIEFCGYKKIKHIPYVLYHKQANVDSRDLLDCEKSAFEKLSLKGLRDHLSKQGAKVKLAELPSTYKVQWPLPKNLPLVSIIIPTKNAQNLVKRCIESILSKTDYTHYEILLVDNNSDELEAIEYFNQLAKINKVKLLSYKYPFNYSAINNFAAQKANGEILLLLNNDVEVINDSWLFEMVSQALRPDIGCVGAKLYYPNDTIQHAGVIVGLWGCAGHSHKHYSRFDNGYMNRLKLVQNYSAVTGACLAVRKELYWQVGGLNEKELTVAFNDVDFCLKVQAAGYRNLWTPYAELYHHESISRGADDTPEKIARVQKEIAYMRKTWKLDKIVDPAYSPWLTKDREDFSF